MEQLYGMWQDAFDKKVLNNSYLHTKIHIFVRLYYSIHKRKQQNCSEYLIVVLFSMLRYQYL